MADGTVAERRYTRTGVVAHLVDRTDLRDSAGHARCGTYAYLGTGSQEEYERAAALPLCARCQAFRGSDQ